jgi:hypothetical protein
MTPSTKYQRETCSDRCRKAVSRGDDLKYLRHWPEERARTRRALHQTIRDDIALQKFIREQRRAHREAARRKQQQRLSLHSDPYP